MMSSRNYKSVLGIACCFILCLNSLFAQEFPEPMIPLRLVNDYTGLLSEREQQVLNRKLQTFNDETSTQIYVVTYDELQGYDVADYGVRLAEEWKIGQQGKDNGILVLISPALHRMTVQTGYGMEGSVPDAIAKRLIDQVLTPAFRQEQYYTGLDSVTNVLISLTRGEYTADHYLEHNANESNPFPFLILAFIFFTFFGNIFRSRRRYYSPTRSIPWWLIMGAAGSAGRSWGNFNSGSGSFGGFSGGSSGGFGGFSGGGGGSFGGGGASGGW